MVRISGNAPISTRRHRVLAIEYVDGPAHKFFDLTQMYSVFFYANWTALEAQAMRTNASAASVPFLEP